MIIDILKNASDYVALNPHFAKAFAFLNREDLADLEVGRHDVDGQNVYAVVAKGHGRKAEEALIETHDHYIDIQFVLRGTDSIGWKARHDLGPTIQASDPRSDVDFYEDPPTHWTDITPGMLGIYFPEDGHMPMISEGELHKVIVKVAMK
ncbi:YhcH/YjgK/YiaL family protein [Pseudodesulfovibrio piezophilus]|uniref:YhcH/YjgK/YiaL family protein n=1 Tax=Pseudodesulfovibrio piezophilus (strain DSM 21447 / JCM 15486 / C1TLV30) TaxID=1322246 RepID=M1WLK6_PSEP2|nr:YhcH/YjgK/YiaL family protein [Pseudodesulfovibrio piezophilus]CCH48025.1 conserved protein of unknown function [Pseudodesulfovibrio piezophilus C1TLV30]